MPSGILSSHLTQWFVQLSPKTKPTPISCSSASLKLRIASSKDGLPPFGADQTVNLTCGEPEKRARARHSSRCCDAYAPVKNLSKRVSV